MRLPFQCHKQKKEGICYEKIKPLLLLCLCIILSGCQKMEASPVLTYEEVQQEMLDYLEHKYNEEFEVFGMDYKSWYNGGIETMLAYPKGENENNVFFCKTYRKESNYR